jgi:hypothetical protein
MKKISLFSEYILLLFVLLFIFFIIILYKFNNNNIKNKNYIDTFQGVDQSGALQDPNPNLTVTGDDKAFKGHFMTVTGTSDEITDLNTYSQRITNLEGRVTTMEQKIQSFQNAMTTQTSS